MNRERTNFMGDTESLSPGDLEVAALRDQVREFELNPVIVHEDGSGLTVADALLFMKP